MSITFWRCLARTVPASSSLVDAEATYRVWSDNQDARRLGCIMTKTDCASSSGSLQQARRGPIRLARNTRFASCCLRLPASTLRTVCFRSHHLSRAEHESMPILHRYLLDCLNSDRRLRCEKMTSLNLDPRSSLHLEPIRRSKLD